MYKTLQKENEQLKNTLKEKDLIISRLMKIIENQVLQIDVFISTFKELQRHLGQGRGQRNRVPATFTTQHAHDNQERRCVCVCVLIWLFSLVLMSLTPPFSARKISWYTEAICNPLNVPREFYEITVYLEMEHFLQKQLRLQMFTRISHPTLPPTLMGFLDLVMYNYVPTYSITPFTCRRWPRQMRIFIQSSWWCSILHKGNNWGKGK